MKARTFLLVCLSFLLTAHGLAQTPSSTPTGPPAWIQLATSGGPPPQRKFHSSVYDPSSNRLIVFGGCSAGTCQQVQATLNDVWVLTNADGLGGASTWIQLNPTGGPPPARHSHVAVYDPVSNRMVVWSGDSLFFSAPNLADVWVLTNANGLDMSTGQPTTPQWIQLFPTGTPPSGGSNPGRETSAAVYDTSSNRMIVFGGATCDPCTAHNDVRVLSNANGLGGAPQWIQLFPTGGPPSPRVEHTVVYDSPTDRMIVFGGGATAALNDAWVLATASGVNRNSGSPVTPQWIQLATAGGPPAARGFHAAAYDSTTNRMVIFGGSSGFSVGPPGPTPFNDVWILTNANGVGAQTPTWNQLTPGGAPPSGRAVFHHRGLYNPSSNRMVIYGGASDLSATATTHQDSWVLSVGDGIIAPVIRSISPTSGTQGQTITNFTVNGNNFQPCAVLSFSGTGITVNSYSSRTATQIMASITIASNAPAGARDVIVTNPDGQQATKSGAFTVFAAIIGQPAISVSPSPIIFPPTSLARTSAPIVVTITNPGTATLSISNITTQSPFSLGSPLPTSVPAGGQATFNVTFSAKGPGSLPDNSFSDKITIASNAPSFPSFFIRLKGTVIIPEMRFDPVCDAPCGLMEGPAITMDTKMLALASKGRPVQGVAADGVTQIVLRIPANFPTERLALTVLNDQDSPSTSTVDDGALASIGDATIGDPNITRGAAVLQLSALDTADSSIGPMAFAIYRAPINFVRTLSSDRTASERGISVRIESMDVKTFAFNIPVRIFRPLVVLIHGLWETAGDWFMFTPLLGDARFEIRTIHYSDQLKGITATDPMYDAATLAKADPRQNALGFDYNTGSVLADLRNYIATFKSGRNQFGAQLAATQADIVAHSMGGDIARALSENPQFYANNTFGRGLIHKLITVGTPHLGTPLATKLLDDDNKCVRDVLASMGRPAFNSVKLTAGTFNGGVYDLRGDGLGAPLGLSGALSSLQDRFHSPIPTALIAGVMSQSQLEGLNCSSFGSILGCPAGRLRYHCKGSPLADSLTVTGWPTIVGQSSDAFIPVSSQLNNRFDVGFQCRDLSQDPCGPAVHSSGALELSFAGPHEYQEQSSIPLVVLDLLNRFFLDNVFVGLP